VHDIRRDDGFVFTIYRVELFGDEIRKDSSPITVGL